MSMESQVEEKLCSNRAERGHQSGWISGIFRRKKKIPSQEDGDSEHHISEDSRLVRRHKAKNLHFSLSEIMRKLKHAIRKEKLQHAHRLLEKKKSFQKSLSTKDHFFLERMTSISRKRSHREHYDSEKHLSEMLRNQRTTVWLPEYSSPFCSPGRIWDQNSTVLSRSSSDDFMNSETVADDFLTIKEIDSASPLEAISPFISKSNQIAAEISKVEAHGGENEGGILEEPLFIENPARGEAKIQKPQCSQLQEDTGGMDDKESVFKYIKAVLDAIDSNWEELYLKTESSDQLLYPALISNIPFYPNKLCSDHELLFDGINEVLFDFCRYPQWVSFVKPRSQVLAFSIESIVSEVQEKVYHHLLPMQIPRPLDQIVREEMATPRSWLDTRCDLECIGFETSELILDELVEEVMSETWEEGMIKNGYCIKEICRN
ncbi:hypothetical protein CARUB_v10009199mg [Capsella rubella]|uniref:DUF4378 domain-containing protein n=1 Tax=Capsella rubella TaxID=81985 RepID=R0IP70_9BRAS|nr:uncharacterized protein LOC17899442 [Capsella rubella]EOA40475.1 hypothetical protein CARUB_v10009199mg [Capsella rubella]